MKKLILSLTLIGMLATPLLAQAPPTAAPAAAPAPAAAVKPPEKAEPNVEQRVADLEAYVGNGFRGSADAKANVKSKLDDVAGPGHNGFMMICAALVLFMTLPGLAL
ncbi:MAG: ammonia channel protein, partial [Pedosphaera sp. Tous-C6FEB]